MPSDESALAPRHLSLSLFQTNRDLVRPDVLLDEIHSVFLRAYAGVQNAVHHIIRPTSSPQTISSETVCATKRIRESKHLLPPKPFVSDAQPVNQQLTVRDNDAEGESTLSITLHDRNSHPPRGADNTEETTQTAINKEHECMGKAAFISLFLFLIMLPGLILGLATKRIEWAIAVSGAVTPAFVFFGGLYYNHKR